MLVSCEYGLTPTDSASRLRDLCSLGSSENWGKKGIEVHLSLATRFLTPLNNGPTLSLAFLLLPKYLQRQPFLLSSTPPCQLWLQMSFGFPYSIPTCPGNVSVSSHWPLPASVSVCFLFVLRLSQDHHIHPWWPSVKLAQPSTHRLRLFLYSEEPALDDVNTIYLGPKLQHCTLTSVECISPAATSPVGTLISLCWFSTAFQSQWKVWGYFFRFKVSFTWEKFSALSYKASDTTEQFAQREKRLFVRQKYISLGSKPNICIKFPQI